MATAAGEQAITVTSPYDGRAVGRVERHDAASVAEAVSAAHAALDGDFPAHERAEVLDRAAELVKQRAEAIARTIGDEAGKPIAAARVEVARAVDTLRFSAVEARTLVGHMVPMEGSASGSGKLAFTIRKPLGVVGAITPFNFPLNLSCHKIAPALAAGCTVVHKPASATPLSAVQLQRILFDAGLPHDRYRLVFGPGGEIGDALVNDERVRAISFTGSSEVGWGIRERAARKHVSLELGNSTPLLVFADADIAATADTVAQHGYGFAGQSCISIQRVLVERSAYRDFVDALVPRVTELRLGDPADDSTQVGPVIDESAAQRIAAWIREAVDGGARLECGGGRTGALVEPTVLSDVTPDMKVSCQELFGPAVAVSPFDSEQEALAMANGTPYGLQAGVMTRDFQRALRVARALQFGGVTVNEAPTFRADQMPYGGVKDSGNTREGPRYAVRELTESALIVLSQ